MNEELYQFIIKETEYIHSQTSSSIEIRLGRLSELERMVRVLVKGQNYFTLLELIGSLSDEILFES